MFPWAYATLGERLSGACLEMLAAHAQKQLPHFKEQELAMTMWAFAKIDFSPDIVLLRSCEAHAARIAGAFTPQALVRRCLFLVNRQYFGTVEMQVMLCTSHCNVFGVE